MAVCLTAVQFEAPPWGPCVSGSSSPQAAEVTGGAAPARSDIGGVLKAWAAKQAYHLGTVAVSSAAELGEQHRGAGRAHAAAHASACEFCSTLLPAAPPPRATDGVDKEWPR